MAEFKLCIGDPSSSKSYQMEVKDAQAKPFMGLNIDEKVKGELIDMTGYEFQITGGSDKAGFPMRHGILGVRKKINSKGGVGFRKKVRDGMIRQKTVCGHKVNADIVQINLKVTKTGTKKLDAIFSKEESPKEGDAPKEAAKEEKPKAEEKPKEEKKEAPKTEAKEEKKEAPEAKPKEEKKPEAKKEEKPAEVKK